MLPTLAVADPITRPGAAGPSSARGRDRTSA